MLIFILLFLISLTTFYTVYWKRRNLPPGPIPLPFVGNILDLYKFGIFDCLPHFRQKFGDLYTIWFGEQPFVTFNNYELIYESFVKNGDAFAGRPKNKFIAELVRGGEYGIVLTDGPLWREHRRFALHVLRNFGLGKNLMQERVLNEVSWLLEDLKMQVKNKEPEISVQKSIDVAIGSVINSLVFGYSFHETSLDEFYTIKGFLKRFSRMAGSSKFRVLAGDKYNILRKLPVFSGMYNHAQKEMSVIKTFFYKQITERMAKINFDEDSEPTDYVEAYLRQQKKLEDSGEKDHLYSNQQLFGSVFDLWLAGQETTSNTLAWLVLYLMTNPEAQTKLHLELSKIIGSDRIISLDDKNSLPYVNAVIAETQRLCNLLPHNVPHRLINDVNIHGYSLKADTIVVPQISQVLYDEKIFPEPHKFIPERFLDSDGKFQTKPELIPFSVGKRACLGESLARLELYLFASNLFNHFEINILASKPANTTRIMGGTVQPEAFVCQLKERYIS
uniref:Cytochrome P450 n=1 Tax=Panagrolaimus sp. PS1159 TaxID=55785 RepID=A0AC35FL80_9BILA